MKNCPQCGARTSTLYEPKPKDRVEDMVLAAIEDPRRAGTVVGTYCQKCDWSDVTGSVHLGFKLAKAASGAVSGKSEAVSKLLNEKIYGVSQDFSSLAQKLIMDELEMLGAGAKSAAEVRDSLAMRDKSWSRGFIGGVTEALVEAREARIISTEELDQRLEEETQRITESAKKAFTVDEVTLLNYDTAGKETLAKTRADMTAIAAAQKAVAAYCKEADIEASPEDGGWAPGDISADFGRVAASLDSLIIRCSIAGASPDAVYNRVRKLCFLVPYPTFPFMPKQLFAKISFTNALRSRIADHPGGRCAEGRPAASASSQAVVTGGRPSSEITKKIDAAWGTTAQTPSPDVRDSSTELAHAPLTLIGDAELESVELAEARTPGFVYPAPGELEPDTDAAGRRKDRKQQRDAYKEECKLRGVRVTDLQIAKAANSNWHSRTSIQKWLACDPRYDGGPDRLIRAVFTLKPHLPKG